MEVLAANGDRKKALLTLIRNQGAEQHNMQVSKDGTGDIAVVYRPTWCMDATDYQSCEWCHGWYRPRQLWRHKRNCKLKPVQSRGGVRRVASGMILTSDISPEVKTVIAGMQSGQERLIVSKDTLMHMLAAKLLSRSAHSKHHTNYIRSRLRTLARLLIQLRKTDSRLQCADLQTAIAPRFFRSVIQAVQVISGYDNKTHTYTAPSLAIRLGHDLRKCAQLLRSAALEKEDSTTAANAQQFNELCATEWNDDVGGSARRVLQDRKMNKKFLLPLTADVSKLTSHLREIMRTSVAVIQVQLFDMRFVEAFKRLTEAVLAMLILFNRRRQGEVSRLTVALYRDAATVSRQTTDVDSSLSPLEKHLLNAFHRVEIPGKRNRCVPLLMTSEQKSAVDLLSNQQLRSNAGVSADNEFVFAATKGSMNHIRGNDVLRNHAALCGAHNPADLTSTNLRKHIATLSQVMNLQRHELDQLASFMGHNIDIHREYYRLPNDVLQTAKVAKILLAMEKGQISSLHGKSLDDVEVCPDDGE